MLNQLTIRPKFAIECLQRSNQQGVGYFEAKFGEERVDQFKPNFNPIWERYGVVVHKRNCMDIFRRLSTIHEHDRQTNRPRNGNIDSNRQNRLSALSPNS